MKNKIIVFGTVLMAVAFFASTVSAAPAATSTKKTVKVGSSITSLQSKADKEIDRRVEALNKLQERIQNMKKLAGNSKEPFFATIQSQITLLNNLKTKIDADTDLTTLKADVQSITKQYRIYALIMPQISVIVAADRLASTTDLVTNFADKLQKLIGEAQVAGKDVTALQKLLADMRAKINDANTKTASAIVKVVSLKPDNGDKTVAKSNTEALKAAKDDIKAGTQALKDAHKNGIKIRNTLKTLMGGSTATTTATTTSTTTPR